jgi:hypothetical protein
VLKLNIESNIYNLFFYNRELYRKMIYDISCFIKSEVFRYNLGTLPYELREIIENTAIINKYKYRLRFLNESSFLKNYKENIEYFQRLILCNICVNNRLDRSTHYLGPLSNDNNTVLCKYVCISPTDSHLFNHINFNYNFDYINDLYKKITTFVRLLMIEIKRELVAIDTNPLTCEFHNFFENFEGAKISIYADFLEKRKEINFKVSDKFYKFNQTIEYWSEYLENHKEIRVKTTNKNYFFMRYRRCYERVNIFNNCCFQMNNNEVIVKSSEYGMIRFSLNDSTNYFERKNNFFYEGDLYVNYRSFLVPLPADNQEMNFLIKRFQDKVIFLQNRSYSYRIPKTALTCVCREFYDFIRLILKPSYYDHKDEQLKLTLEQIKTIVWKKSPTISNNQHSCNGCWKHSVCIVCHRSPIHLFKIYYAFPGIRSITDGFEYVLNRENDDRFLEKFVRKYLKRRYNDDDYQY